MSRFWRILLKSIAALFAIMILATALLVWRLSTGPMTATFLTPYFESIVNNYIPGTHTRIASTVLTWDNVEHSVAVHADNLRVYEADVMIADVPHVDIRLSVWGIMVGQFMPLDLMVDHPQFKLERDADGSIHFGDISAGGNNAESGDIKDATARIADNLTHAMAIQHLQVTDAVFDVNDMASKNHWSVHIPDISVERVKGTLTGHLSINVTQKDKASTVDVNYVYDRRDALHEFDTKLTDITPAFFAGGHPETLGLGPAAIFDLPISGTLSISFDNKLDIAAASLDMEGGSGFINDPDFWDQPRAVKSLKLQADYDRKKGLNLSAADIDFGGPTLSMTATGKPPLLPTHDLDFEMKLQLANWPMDQFGSLWPKPIIPNARAWIAANMVKGDFSHGEATFKGELTWAHLGDMTITEGEGKIAAGGARLTYIAGMPPLENVGATATFDLDHMAVQITGGGVDGLKLLPFTLQITDFQKDLQYIDIPLQLTGSIPDVLDFINAPRFRYADAVGLKPGDISGEVKGMVHLHFPLLNDLQMKDVDLKVDAGLANVASSKLVQGVDITQGNLALALDKAGFQINGPAALNKIPAQIDWKQTFNKVPGKPLKEAVVTTAITPDEWKNLGIDALNGTQGAVPATIQLTQPDKGRTLLSGKLDMTGAEIHVSQLNWIKPANAPAILKFAADLSNEKVIKITSVSLKGDQADIEGNASLNADGHLVSLKLDPLILGRTNAALSYSELPDNHGISYDVQGASLDVSGIKGGKEPEHNNPQPKSYSFNLGKLYTGETGFLSDVKGHAVRDPQGWLEIDLQGIAQGDHKLNISLKPDKDGRKIFSITCDDFGKALQGMGFTDTVSGGKLDVTGESPAGKPRIIVGHVKIGGFTVKNLPVLALLLNATTPFGFSGLLTDSADFNSLTGKFTWEGDQVELRSIRVAGSSVGMNIDGKVDLNTGNANLYGTLVPFSMVNRVLGAIPIIGDVITGGEGGGVLAVSYTIKGPLAKPDVNVNPVSLLTPGFLRNLFFGGGDDSDEPPATTGKSPPQPAQSNINQAK